MDTHAVREFVTEAESILEASPQMDEEKTKLRLVLPFIELLGWNTRAIEVEPEHTVRMATGKTKVDFALLVGETPVVFIEAKPARSTLDTDSVAQLRSYMRQALEVDWGVLTNGKSFEVLTKGDDGRKEELSLVQFDLEELKDRPEILEIISKESIQSGKSDEIAEQIANASTAITQLKHHKEQVATAVDETLTEEIGVSVPIDTEAQATDFVDDVISALEEQRRAIGTTRSTGESVDTPETGDTTDATERYVIKIQDEGETTIETITDGVQGDVMAEAVDYLIENHELISRIEPLPYVPGPKNAILSSNPIHPDGERQMRAYRELAGGYYLNISLDGESKKRYIKHFVSVCNLSGTFDGNW